MKTAARSALATVTALLIRAGFKAHVATGRNRRPGFHTRDGRTIGCARGVVLFDYTTGNGDFPKMCAAGYALTDAEGGANYVARGCARGIAPAAAVAA